MPSGSLTFAAGENSKTITLNINGDDSTVESDESFSVNLSNTSPGTSITTPSVTGTILNDDALLSVSKALSSNWEGNTGKTPLTFTVTRSGFLNQTTTVGWSVVGSGINPTNASDFDGGILPSGTVSFAAGETTKTITVNVAGDTNIEALSETFSLLLNSPSAGAIIDTTSATSGATGTIYNDDGISQLSISPVTSILNEGTSSINGTTPYAFTITRDINLVAASSVTWTVTGTGTNPTNASDFLGALTGTVSFAQNESTKTINVLVNQDSIYEPNETFSVVLSNPQNATINVDNALGTIADNDTNWAISTTDISKSEGNSGSTIYTYTITQLGLPSWGTVYWQVNGSSVNAADFIGNRLPKGRLDFTGNQISQNITIEVAGDSFNEADETFSVSLTSNNFNMPVYPYSGSVISTIANDDASLAIINGTSSNDTLLGTLANDMMYGYNGNDSLIGGAGDDLLIGGNGADILNGGVGNDTINLTETIGFADKIVLSSGTGTVGTLVRASSLGMDTIIGIDLGTNSTAADILCFSATDFGIVAATPVIRGSINIDGNYYINSLSPTSTPIDLNGSASQNGSAIVFIGSSAGTNGVSVYFTTNEGAFSTSTSVEIVRLVGVNTSILDATDILFTV